MIAFEYNIGQKNRRIEDKIDRLWAKLGKLLQCWTEVAGYWATYCTGTQIWLFRTRKNMKHGKGNFTKQNENADVEWHQSRAKLSHNSPRAFNRAVRILISD